MENHTGQLREFLHRGAVCMVGTIDGGKIQFRPMFLAEVDEMGSLWFFASLDSTIAGQVQDSTYVEIVYTEKDSLYMSISGMGLLGNENRQKMEELFDESIEPWFPQGLQTPSLALMKVRPTEINYWTLVPDEELTKVTLLPDLLKQHD